jgi:hypothetical protein
MQNQCARVKSFLEVQPQKASNTEESQDLNLRFFGSFSTLFGGISVLGFGEKRKG